MSMTKLETVTNPIVRAEHLSKLYGKLIAVNDVSFEIKEGEIFGFLGPNGGWKEHDD